MTDRELLEEIRDMLKEILAFVRKVDSDDYRDMQAFMEFLRNVAADIWVEETEPEQRKQLYNNIRWLYITLHQSKIIYIYTEIRTGFHQNPLPSGNVVTSKDSFDFLIILKAPLISALIIAPDPVLNKPRLERLPL